MTPLRRWLVVAAVALTVVAVLVVPRTWPVGAVDVSAADLLARVQGSTDVAYSGLVRSDGAVQLPVGDDLGDVGELLAGSQRLRVWWQDADAWRVDRLLVSGERDLVHRHGHTIDYDYERARATVSDDASVRLPRTTDLLPPELARGALEDATANDVRRLAARRVAGVSAAGLRYTPSGPTTVASVDVWADPDTGLPLRVEMRSSGADRPTVASAFDEVDLHRPSDGDVRFDHSDAVDVRFERTIDIADAAGRYAPFVLPTQVAGFERRTEGDVAAGVFGSGVSRFIVVPLRSREADPLRDRLRSAPDVATSPYRTVVSDGALTVMLTGEDGDDGASWLVAGSVPAAVLLDQVARPLLALPFVDRDR